MFLRRKQKRVDGIDYDYWALCETVRTAAGPRQRVVASLGKLDEHEVDRDAGWEDMDALLEGRKATGFVIRAPVLCSAMGVG